MLDGARVLAGRVVQVFGLDPAVDCTDLDQCGIQAVVYDVFKKDHNGSEYTTQVPSVVGDTVLAVLRKSPNITGEIMVEMQKLINSHATRHNQVVILARDVVHQELAGHADGQLVRGRLRETLTELLEEEPGDTLYLRAASIDVDEPQWRTTTLKEYIRLASATWLPLMERFSGRREDRANRPVVVIPKSEEHQVTLYGDVGFVWPPKSDLILPHLNMLRGMERQMALEMTAVKKLRHGPKGSRGEEGPEGYQDLHEDW